MTYATTRLRDIPKGFYSDSKREGPIETFAM